MDSTHCYNCGAMVLQSHKFCFSCGIRLDWTFLTSTKTDQSSTESHPQPLKDNDIVDLFRKIENTLKKESSFSEEEFDANWGKFKKFHYKKYDDNDVYWIFVKVAFYSGMKAGIVTSKLPRIKKYFGKYQTVKNYSKSDVDRILTDTGIIRFPRKIQGCISNARLFADIVERNGSFGAYLESFGDLSDDSVLEKVRNELMQFDFIGPTTALHVMLDLGLNVWKPDRVMCRILDRIGLLTDRNDIDQAVLIGKRFAKKIGLPIRYIDIVMVKYGQKGPEEGFGLKDGICLEKNPRCGVCGITEYCRYAYKNLPR